MTRPLASLLLAVSVQVTLGACYDWQIGGGPSDAAMLRDAASPDAHMSLGDAGAEKHDAVGGTDAHAEGSGAVDAGHPVTDAGTPHDVSAPSCATLAANVSVSRALAQSCSFGSMTQCMTAVRDPCGCNTYVASASATATSNYAAAVTTFADAGCTPTCPGCVEPGATTGACLEMGTGSGVTSACTP